MNFQSNIKITAIKNRPRGLKPQSLDETTI